jgi:nicotinamidase-related amidase
VNLSRAALLLVDMNRSHLDHEMGHLLVAKPDADRIIEAAVRVREAWAATGRPVIFVRTHHRWNAETGEVIDNKNPFWMAQHAKPIPGLAKPRRTLAVEGAVVTEVVPQLAPRPGEHTVFKHRYSPFHNTDMELLLKNLDVDTLVIGGVNTNNCILCTCFEAFNRDFRVVLMPDVCASMNGADYHDASLKLIEAALGWLVPSTAIIAAISTGD